MGLKENVIVGRLIPAGTGRVMSRLNAALEGLDEQEALEVDEAALEATLLDTNEAQSA